jgi:PAS domain S-box-containing protein
VFAGSFLGASAGTALVLPGVSSAVFFPPYAVLTAALLLSPVRHWWLYALASAAGNFWPHLHHEGPTWFIAEAEIANITRAVVAAAGVRWLGDRTGFFNTGRNRTVFLTFTALIGPAIGALIGAAFVTQRTPGTPFWDAWQAWLLSNMLTGLLLLPLILMICLRPWPWVRRGARVPAARIAEALVLSIGVVAVSVYVFDRPHPGGVIPVTLYAPLPLLIWAAVRFGPGSVIAALSVVATFAIAGLIAGRGPFNTPSRADDLIQVQYFLIALCAVLLPLAALARQQTRTADDLRQSQAHYRAVVEDQTELICRFLPDGTHHFVNGAYCRHAAQPPEVLLTRTVWNVLPPEAAEEARARLATLTRNHPTTTIEFELPGPERRWLLWTYRALFDDRGRIVAYQGVGRDTTARREAQESLHRALNEVSLLKERLEAENTYLQEELSDGERAGDIVCRSPHMRRVLAQVERVAPTDTTVLILGETGVGKELIARAIYRASERKAKPFVRLNCAALPPELIESELFGHERGAFTGAVSRRAGRFEVADGATLFLDEIGELPLEMQSKLLRVLQEGEFERLGSSQTIRVDFRLIAATSKNLDQGIKAGTFRADLYYRLNVFPILVPPLRERKEDILPLASTFLMGAAQRLGRVFGPITMSVAADLLRHPWPGNVRELKNVIDRAAISSPADNLQLPLTRDSGSAAPGQTPQRIAARQGLSITPLPTANPMSASTPPANHELSTNHDPAPSSSIRDVERSHILSVLERTRWRIEGRGGAAEILEMKPSTLRFRMKKLDIARQ